MNFVGRQNSTDKIKYWNIVTTNVAREARSNQILWCRI